MIAPHSKHRDGYPERHPAQSLPPQAGLLPQPGLPSQPGFPPPAGFPHPAGFSPQTGGAGANQFSALLDTARAALGGASDRLPLAVLIGTAAALGVTAGWLIKRR